MRLATCLATREQNAHPFLHAAHVEGIEMHLRLEAAIEPTEVAGMRRRVGQPKVREQR